MSHPIGSDPGLEENPEPEEDSDWNHSQERESSVENPQHEDPEAISEIGAGLQAESVLTAQDAGEINEEAKNSLAQEPVVGDDDVESQSKEEDYIPSSVSPEAESESGCLEDGDSFEQDEEMAAPESENGVIGQACSESDQLLTGAPISGDTSGMDSVATGGMTFPGNDSESMAAVLDTFSNHKTEDDGESSIGENPPVFSGNVQVDVLSGVDAPEDDFKLDPTGCEASALLRESRVSMSVESPAIESQRIGNNSMDGDRDSQVPECDRNEDSSCQSTDGLFQDQRQVDANVESTKSDDANRRQGTEDDVSPPLVDRLSGGGDYIVESAGASCPINSSESLNDNKQKNSEEPVTGSSKTPGANVTASTATDSSPSECQLVHSNEKSPEHQSRQCENSKVESSLSLPVKTCDSGLTSSIEASTLRCTSSQDSTRLNSVEAVNINSTSALTPHEDLPTTSKPGDSHSVFSLQTSAATNKLNGSPTKDSHVNVQSDQLVNSECIDTPALSYSSQFSTKERGSLSSEDIQKQLALALSKDDDDELDDIMSELDAELMSNNKGFSPKRSVKGQQSNAPSARSLNQGQTHSVVNGMVNSDFKQLQEHNRQLLEQLKIRDVEIKKLVAERDHVKADLIKSQSNEEEAVKKLSESSGHNSDDLYLPQIKELENTIVQQQKEIQFTKDKLISHDTAAKKAVTTLQNELKSRVDQVTKLYEEAVKEKDSMVVMFAASESKVMESKRAVEKIDARLRDAVKEREGLVSTLKSAKTDKQKVVSNLEQKSAEVGNLQKEMEKLKEALSSSDYRIKWFQNKLKDELETHKETKSNLEKTTSKLKEAREETEIIRRECQAIVKTYQESEEIKSNSLDKELKIKDSQLKLRMQEWNDTEEQHQRTKKELESLKVLHKEVVGQAATLKEKVQNLEMAVAEKDTGISQSNELLNRQKTDLTDLTSKLKERENINEDFTRAQEMIKTLDRDISELKITNRDLQKDMDSCRERESKMLALQSELSKTNALLRSENTALSNKATNLTAEVERLKMEIQELETTVRHLTDSLEDEKKNSTVTVAKLQASVEEKTKESSDFKQKWEDEIDSNKTLKRRHANNVKDLTRQLHQTKRRLESLEGSGKDSGGSMGSRTNSNGSLNSMDNSNQPGMAGGAHFSHSQSGATTASAPAQEFPVITEQVEIDKQVLIERIVRLQKSHARKNEKLEFLGEHIQQLLEEIKKKTKIIQSYVMREEAGTLSSEDMDANKESVDKAFKSLLSRKGGIMASVYSLHQQDGAMTLELSLQINKKLQAVLEDTLLKNITLKENLDTLGEEIARLSQVNRKLQLHLQDLENSKKN